MDSKAIIVTYYVGGLIKPYFGYLWFLHGVIICFGSVSGGGGEYFCV